jgi:undecaprenol kinase/diacylglycerol kinase (ATP)
MKNNKFSISKRLKSFKFAFNGLRILLKEEHNSRIHLIAMIIAIILGLIFKIDTSEWIGIILSIGLVIGMELINSSIENLADFATLEKHDLIKKTKDLAAAGVFWSSLAALTIGLIVFIPRLLELIK